MNDTVNVFYTLTLEDGTIGLAELSRVFEKRIETMAGLGAF